MVRSLDSYFHAPFDASLLERVFESFENRSRPRQSAKLEVCKERNALHRCRSQYKLRIRMMIVMYIIVSGEK